MTGKKEYLDAAKKIADYVLPHLEGRWIPKIDYCQAEDDELYDDAAGSITACGLLELADQLGEKEGARYASAARNIMRALDENDCDWTHQTPSRSSAWGIV